MHGREVVTYLRVSTQLQGLDGFGIAAQRDAVSRFSHAFGCTIVAEYAEVETGRKDHLRNRPQLVCAVAHASRSRALLVIARLDRLARSILVTSQLLESGVEFVACDNPHANRLTIQILAAMAEHEGRLISERTKAGLAAARERGVVFGSNNLTPEARRLGQIAAVTARASRTKAAYCDLIPTIANLRATGISTKAIADELNAAGQRNQFGRRWHSTAVNDLCRRESLAPLPGVFQRRTPVFREIQRNGVAAATKRSNELVSTAYALALPLAREAHLKGCPRREIARILNAQEITSPRGKMWRGLSVLIMLRRAGLVESEQRRIHRPTPKHDKHLLLRGHPSGAKALWQSALPIFR